jgi:membrane-bound inhibitor of C-type lysozyme
VAPVTAPVAYDCLPAQLLTVAYDNTGPTPTATLTLDGTTHVLSQVPSASGARYATDTGRTAGKTLVWWTKGQDGTLFEGTVGGAGEDETQIAECSPSVG